jgi:hypothetical protein
VLNGHVLQTQNVLVREQLQQLDFSKRRDGELRNWSEGCRVWRVLHRILTPSFSLCMMIFFKATKAPVFFDLAR